MRSRILATATGPMGTASKVEPEVFANLDQTATLGAWFIDSPASSPFWSCYLLALVHLRPIEGARPPQLQYPGAEYELLLVALNPDAKPVADDVETWAYMSPPNVCVQFDSVTDAQAIELLGVIAQACLDGFLPLESDLLDIENQKTYRPVAHEEIWNRTVRDTADHYIDPTHGGRGHT